MVKSQISAKNNLHLVDVGIRGNNKMELERNKCTFSAVKFESTSYNQEGSKFHLVITVYLLENKFEFPKILIAKISPPVFVDSRKSAKEN